MALELIRNRKEQFDHDVAISSNWALFLKHRYSLFTEQETFDITKPLTESKLIVIARWIDKNPVTVYRVLANLNVYLAIKLEPDCENVVKYCRAMKAFAYAMNKGALPGHVVRQTWQKLKQGHQNYIRTNKGLEALVDFLEEILPIGVIFTPDNPCCLTSSFAMSLPLNPTGFNP